MNNEKETISGAIPEISIIKPEIEGSSSIQKEIARLEAMHVLEEINLGDENDPFSKIYIELLEEYEKKYKELPKEPFVRNTEEAKNILSQKTTPEEIKIEPANTSQVEILKIKKEGTRISPLSLFEEPLNI